LLLLWGALYRVQQIERLASGSLFQLFLAGYLLFRLLIEFLKPDPPVLLGFSSIQIACILGLVYYYKVWLRPNSLLGTTDA
jgi:prolipoprotein diacylglyceryltransferase